MAWLVVSWSSATGFTATLRRRQRTLPPRLQAPWSEAAADLTDLVNEAAAVVDLCERANAGDTEAGTALSKEEEYKCAWAWLVQSRAPTRGEKVQALAEMVLAVGQAASLEDRCAAGDEQACIALKAKRQSDSALLTSSGTEVAKFAAAAVVINPPAGSQKQATAGTGTGTAPAAAASTTKPPTGSQKQATAGTGTAPAAAASTTKPPTGSQKQATAGTGAGTAPAAAASTTKPPTGSQKKATAPAAAASTTKLPTGLQKQAAALYAATLKTKSQKQTAAPPAAAVVPKPSVGLEEESDASARAARRATFAALRTLYACDTVNVTTVLDNGIVRLCKP